ncbi:MAG: ankyrin repeat domain-containing protein [Acidobacteria bacterium]|nr:ankyrin repeat domain-containing protein [Acidobacteriota bacterium]
MPMLTVRKTVWGLLVVAALTFGARPAVAQTPGPTAVADAAQAGDVETVRTLLRQGADVNAAQGDGTTALHWAAMKGNAELAQMLVTAGANLRATTRLGSYTPLYLAARGGHATTVATLVAGGADVHQKSATGATALMLAAAAGDTRTLTSLVEAGADINAKDTARGETPLMYAAAYNRADAVKLLLQRGADTKATTNIVDLAALTAPEEETMARQVGGGAAPAPRRPADVPGLTRPLRYNELIGTMGGLTALHFAARQGFKETVGALLDAGADINQPNPGDHMTPLLIAIVNGHFDLAMEMLQRGADPNRTSINGVAPLFAVLNVYWAPKSLYPGPKTHQQQLTTYMGLMEALLDKGADVNARVKYKVWYQAYNSDFAGVDESGATPFWRAAYASDVDAMKLFIARGADPNVPTVKPAGRPFTGDGVRQVQDLSGLPPVPTGGPAVQPIHAASGVGYGEGFAANAHRYAPTGFLPAIKYLVEELGADVNAVDHEGNTPVHLAASRGDTESILYLVSKGADVTKVNREGNSTADMANGPVQRVQPFPETLAVLEKLGATNNHKCVTCE